jgi:hypothetical protein
MSKKPATPPEAKPTAPDVKKVEKKLTAKKPVNPFTAENGRKLGRAGKSGPSRTAWRA